MVKTIFRIPVILSLCFVASVASAQAPCPGYNPNKNVNLACEIPTAARVSTSGTQTLGQLSPTVAAQLSQLPLTTAVSGIGLAFTKTGLPTVSTESLGTILTQRGESIGRHKWFVSFNYQRFGFGSIDGISLKHLDTVNQAGSGSSAVFIVGKNRVDLLVDQFTAAGTFGLLKNVDVSVLVPFSKVTLKSGSSGTQFDSQGNPIPIDSLFLAGSATGIGDVAVSLKYNVVKLEHTAIAVAGELRLPTGDETNYLGTGSYGLKPYFIISRSGRLTPSINLGYQWNSASSLFVSPTGAHLNLPSSFLYSGGLDFRATKKLTLTSEFLGQAVIDGPRLLTSPAPPIVGAGARNLTTVSETYAIDNAGVGFKINPFKGLLITGNALFKLDDGGLRSKVVPLVGISYKF